MLCSHISIIIRDTKPTNNLEYSILKMHSYPAAHINAWEKIRGKKKLLIVNCQLQQTIHCYSYAAYNNVRAHNARLAVFQLVALKVLDLVDDTTSCVLFTYFDMCFFSISSPSCGGPYPFWALFIPLKRINILHETEKNLLFEINYVCSFKFLVELKNMI